MILQRVQNPILAVDGVRLAVGHPHVRIPVELANEGLQQPAVSEVIGLRYPDILPPRSPDTLVPLLKGAPAISFINNGSHSPLATITSNDPSAVVNRRVIQVKNLEIRISL